MAMYTKEDIYQMVKSGKKVSFAMAIRAGFCCGDQKYQRGYITRKNRDIDTIQIYIAGGSRAGDLYFLAPCTHSTNYCVRQYLI